MIKSWKPVIDDITSEISRINTSIADLPFDSNFPSRIQEIKERTHELEMRLLSTTHQMKAEFAAEREEINLASAEFHSDARELSQAISRLRLFRSERSHANYLHLQELKNAAEKTGKEGGEA